MKGIWRWLIIAFVCSLLLALFSTPLPVLAATSGEQDPPAVESFPAVPLDAQTVISFVISNESPMHFVDWLINHGQGGQTLLEVLGYLKMQSGGIISDAFYNQVAAAPAGSEVFTAKLDNYAGLIGGIEICADGTISIASLEARDYVGLTGYGTASNLDGFFSITYALDSAHNIYTHTNEYGGGITRDYYAFGIAWREPIRIFLPLVLK
jgi:hypothetical protein